MTTMRRRPILGQVLKRSGSLGLLMLILMNSPLCLGSEVDDRVFSAQSAYAAKRYDQALRDYSRAAALGSAIALFQLGVMHEQGQGVKSNAVEAARWYERAADAGSSAGAKKLANMYYDGVGVTKDFNRAAALYLRAGELGDSNSLFTLGQMYLMGSMGARDPQKAVEVFSKAAEKGNPLAMNALGIAYRLGDGVAKSDISAYAYFKLAEETGSVLARENLEKLASVISEADRTAGEKRFVELRGKLSANSKERDK